MREHGVGEPFQQCDRTAVGELVCDGVLDVEASCHGVGFGQRTSDADGDVVDGDEFFVDLAGVSIEGSHGDLRVEGERLIAEHRGVATV